MKIHRVSQINPKTQQMGYGTRAILNGQETWEDLIEYAARNTSIHKAELTAAATLIIEGAVQALKNGKSVDLKELGKIYPTIYGKWTLKAEDQKKADITLGMNYRASDEINEAIAGIKLSWSTKKEEEDDNGGGSTTTDDDQGGGSSQQSPSNGGTTQNNGGTTQNGGTSQNNGGTQNNNNGGSSSQSADGTYWLTIATSGNGTVNVTDENGVSSKVSGNRKAGKTFTVSVVPVAGQTPTATLNHEPITLTENNGTYTGSFVMPEHNALLEVFSGVDGSDNGGSGDFETGGDEPGGDDH